MVSQRRGGLCHSRGVFCHSGYRRLVHLYILCNLLYSRSAGGFFHPVVRFYVANLFVRLGIHHYHEGKFLPLLLVHLGQVSTSVSSGCFFFGYRGYFFKMFSRVERPSLGFFFLVFARRVGRYRLSGREILFFLDCVVCSLCVSARRLFSYSTGHVRYPHLSRIFGHTLVRCVFY